jgi:hypothetical protein
MKKGFNNILSAFLLVFLLLGFISPVNEGGEVTVDLCDSEDFRFQDGEVLIYKLYYNLNFIWLSAGEVVFRVKERKDDFHLKATGRTYKSYEWFFKVRDEFNTYVDKNSLLPNTSQRNILEGKHRYYEKVDFDQEKMKATYTSGKTIETAKLKNTDLSGCMHDILSIVYFMRNMDLESFEKDNHFPIKLFMDREEWPLKITYKGVVNKRIRKTGKVPVHLFEPEVIAGDIFKKGDRMKVYVSNDKNRIPLMIESPVSVGSVKAILKGQYGLKNELNYDK